MTLVERFLKYVSYDTQSNEETRLTPSTPGQMEFAKYLKQELEALGRACLFVCHTSGQYLKTGTDHRIYFAHGYQSGYDWRECFSTHCEELCRG